ncbi:MAG: hypothetical protein CSA96_05695 [Bacteroidetes bacterium]|nr:MAG: hypothetical protein CSA96_05695 [Bacteroidota bacterium]
MRPALFSFSVFFFLGTLSLFSQDASNPDTGQGVEKVRELPSFSRETSFGIRGGANVSRVGFSPSLDQRLTSGFFAGLAFRHIEQQYLGIGIELNYLQAGWSEPPVNGKQYMQRLTYLQLPVLSHFYFGKRKTRMFFNLGPYVSFLLSVEESGMPPDELALYPHQEADSPGEYGLSGGIGLSRQFVFGRVQLEGRVNYGLSNVFRYDIDGTFLASQNQIAELALSCYFNSPF